MAIVLDYTSRIAPAALKEAGVIGVCRYLSLPTLGWKTIKQAEYDELTRAGIVVTLNWELAADDWKTGATGGINHARMAVAQAKALGYPQGKVPILGSADFDMSVGQWNASGRAYARAFAETVREAGYRPGVYGPWDVLNWVKQEGIMDAFWQAGMSTAWSNGRNRNRWPGAHLRQMAHKRVGGTDTDWNEILINPLWGLDSGGSGMASNLKIAAIKHADGTPGWLVGDGIWYTAIVTWPEHQQRIAEGAVEKEFPPPDGTSDWGAWVGRISAVSGTTGTSIEITQDQLNAAIAANVPAIVQELTEHIKSEFKEV